MKTEVKKENGYIYTYTNYNSVFINKARKLGGKWDSSKNAWRFSLESEKYVRSLCIEIYGTDGTYKAVMTRVRINYNDSCVGSLEMFGITLVRVLGRDSGIRPAEGVLIVSGDVESGGSMKYPKTCCHNAVFELSIPSNYLDRDDVKYAIEKGIVVVLESSKRSSDAILKEIKEHEDAILKLRNELRNELNNIQS